MISKHFTVLTSLFLCLSGTAVAWCNDGSDGVSWSKIGNDTGIGEAFRTACDGMALKGDIKIGDNPHNCVPLGNGFIYAEISIEEGTETSLLLTETCKKLLDQAKDSCAAFGGSIWAEAASGYSPNEFAWVRGTVTANPLMVCPPDQQG